MTKGGWVQSACAGLGQTAICPAQRSSDVYRHIGQRRFQRTTCAALILSASPSQTVLVDALEASKTTSPFDRLPPEIIVSILKAAACRHDDVRSGLGNSGRHMFPFTSLAVCSRWRTVALAATALWTTICMPTAPLTKPVLANWARKLNRHRQWISGKLKQLILISKGDLSIIDLQQVVALSLKTLPQIQSFHILRWSLYVGAKPDTVALPGSADWHAYWSALYSPAENIPATPHKLSHLREVRLEGIDLSYLESLLVIDLPALETLGLQVKTDPPVYGLKNSRLQKFARMRPLRFLSVRKLLMYGFNDLRDVFTILLHAPHAEGLAVQCPGALIGLWQSFIRLGSQRPFDAWKDMDNPPLNLFTVVIDDHQELHCDWIDHEDLVLQAMFKGNNRLRSVILPKFAEQEQPSLNERITFQYVEKDELRFERVWVRLVQDGLKFD